MDFFSSDAFLTALARDYYRAKDFEIKPYDLLGHHVRLAEINGKRPAVTGPFYDYVKPLEGPPPTRNSVKFIPNFVTRTVALDDDEPLANAPRTAQDPAPLIIWDRFTTWNDYEAFVEARSDPLLTRQRKRLRKLTSDYGEPTFLFEDPNPEAFELCVAWKIKQYKGGHETLENPRTVAMLRRLFNEGHLTVSTLKVGDRYVSLHIGVSWRKQFLVLIPSYDPLFAKYSVGKELLHRMLEYSYRRGDERYDFLQGGETYKWDYATHLQIIEPIGHPPFPHHIRSRIEEPVKRTLMRLNPALFYRLKRLIITIRAARQS